MLFNTKSFITLTRLEPLKGSAQVALRLTCALALVFGIGLFSPAYAYAPIKAHIQIKQTPQQYAKATLNSSEYKCLYKLYYYESRWNPKAKNGPHYGIPQGRSIYLKTASPIDQIKWGIKYNRARYNDSMCNALNHFKRWNWH